MTPWTAACQASLSFTISWSLLLSTESVIPTNHLILCLTLLLCPQSFPASGSFPMSQLFASGGQSIGTSASASDLPMNIQDGFPSGLTGLISLLSKGLLRVFSGTTIQCTISNSMHNIYVIDKKNRGLKTKLAIEPDFKVLFFSLKLLHSQNEGHSQKEGHCLCIAFLDDYLI